MELRYNAGSLNNRVTEQCKMPEPKPGDGATELWASDRHAGTILSVHSKGPGQPVDLLTFRRDKAIRTDKNGQSDAQEYRYEPNPEAAIEVFTKRKTGQWVKYGECLRHGLVLAIGDRDEHYDYSF